MKHDSNRDYHPQRAPTSCKTIKHAASLSLRIRTGQANVHFLRAFSARACRGAGFCPVVSEWAALIYEVIREHTGRCYMHAYYNNTYTPPTYFHMTSLETTAAAAGSCV